MTSWEKALKFTLDYEGYYANDPDDEGGETVRGIARKKHPDWLGWAEFDRMREKLGSPHAAARDHVVEAMVHAFYRTEYWDKMRAEEMPWKPAMALFDFAVNSGVKTAVKKLQMVVGVAADGVVGRNTLAAIREAFPGRWPVELGAPDWDSALIEFLARRALYLLAIMFKKPKQRKWAMNWFRRLFKLANVVLEG